LEFGPTRREVLGTTAYILDRTTLRLLDTTKLNVKDKITPIVLVELLRQTTFTNLCQLQNKLYSTKISFNYCLDAVFLLFMVETGLRIGSVTGVNEHVNKFIGIELRDLRFE
jgi:hypothetical protein